MKEDKELIKLFKSWQCDNCRVGRPCKHKIKDCNFYVQEVKTGKRTYYCTAACIFLQLSDKEYANYCNRQWNIEGHYEKLARG